MSCLGAIRPLIPLPRILVGALAAAILLTLASSVEAAPSPRPNRRVCPGPLLGAASCHSRVVTDRRGTPLAGSGPSGYGPADFHGAYALPSNAATAQTIAIVDAYDDPTIESDLATYGATYGLPACTTANGCFRKVNQSGEEGSYPKEEGGWALEIALDVETAHAICQNCKILLVEASSAFFSDLSAAVNTAAALGATQISNSYGGGEYSGETSDATYDQPGIAVTVSAGDSGYAAEYPAASPFVVAVGGTTLNVGASHSYESESVWSGSGSGCSAYEPARAWQTADANWALTGCVAKRGVADVAADANPSTGASVYDTTKYRGQSGWFTVGGTSLSAPLIAGVFALAANGSGSYPAAQLYAHESDSPASLHDVTSGSNGSCGTIMCKGAAGYDGPTGVGTPNGIAAFGATAPVPAEFELTLEKSGEGEGTVSSEPAGIDCGSTCSAPYEEGTAVTLSASPAEGSEFNGWTGCDAESEGKCEVTMSGAKTVEAEFGLEPAAGPTQPLTLEKHPLGTGEGTVASNPAGIECGTACTSETQEFEEGSLVTLTASAAAGSIFKAWTGCAKDTSTPELEEETGAHGRRCTVHMTTALTVTAKFMAVSAITASKSAESSGAGTISSIPAGIACSAPCTTATALFEGTRTVLLRAVPVASSSGFDPESGWNGCDSVNGEGRCEVLASEAKSVEAEFTAIPSNTLSFEKAGAGYGTVTSSPAGISCGLLCLSAKASFLETKTVKLKETPKTGEEFGGWTGCDEVDGEGRCVVTTGTARTVTAEFK
jgi:hypothetical protein